MIQLVNCDIFVTFYKGILELFSLYGSFFQYLLFFENILFYSMQVSTNVKEKLSAAKEEVTTLFLPEDHSMFVFLLNWLLTFCYTASRSKRLLDSERRHLQNRLALQQTHLRQKREAVPQLELRVVEVRRQAPKNQLNSVTHCLENLSLPSLLLLLQFLQRSRN